MKGKPAPLKDATLSGLTGYRLQRANSAASSRFKAAFAEFGLRRTTFSCLSLIVDNPGLRQSQLGEALAIERPNLGQIVEDLTQQGLILRETSKTDRRAYALSPTSKGLRLFADALAAVRATDAHITAGMSQSEVQALRKALGYMLVNAASDSEPATDGGKKPARLGQGNGR